MGPETVFVVPARSNSLGETVSAKLMEGAEVLSTHHVNIVTIQGQWRARVYARRGKDGLIEFRFGSFNDIATVEAKDVVQLWSERIDVSLSSLS